MATGMNGFLGDCATRTNIYIPRQSIHDCLGGERTNFLEDQAHRSVVQLHSRQNCRWDNPSWVLPH
jgi:hypothetical protein